MRTASALTIERAKYRPKLPRIFAAAGLKTKLAFGQTTTAAGAPDEIQKQFPHLFGAPVVTFKPDAKAQLKPLNVGVILSGGQAPGGHNVIGGIFDALKAANRKSRLYGFLGGPSGVVDNKYKELTAEIIKQYRNTGGFDIIGSGRTKLESVEQFEKTRATLDALNIQALVIIGGDDSNTNAALLAEHFLQVGAAIQVIGVPKTIDGDLKNEQIACSFGFDTACKTYSELVGNICRDANSARKYWHFIKLMGRSASHIALEVALQTQPNITIISEEVAAKNMTLREIVDGMVDVVVKRAAAKKNFGVALVPEGLIEFIPEVKHLIGEINDILAKEAAVFKALPSFEQQRELVAQKLSQHSAAVLGMLPSAIQRQLLLDRDPHGNVQVSLIETEKLLVDLISVRLKELKAAGAYAGKFAAQCHFFGYEGRCAAPTNFDADYCYALGYTAAGLIQGGLTGYIVCIKNLAQPAGKWVAGGVPLTLLMTMERRHGAAKPVIRKALVELADAPFKACAGSRAEWAQNECYLNAGPIQYFGPAAVCDATTLTLRLEQKRK